MTVRVLNDALFNEPPLSHLNALLYLACFSNAVTLNRFVSARIRIQSDTKLSGSKKRKRTLVQSYVSRRTADTLRYKTRRAEVVSAGVPGYNTCIPTPGASS
jgi:hypothetical protein